MNGLPPGTDLSFLRGVELLQVCVGAKELILTFHPDMSVTIDGTFQVEASGGRAERLRTRPDRQARLSGSCTTPWKR